MYIHVHVSNYVTSLYGVVYKEIHSISPFHSEINQSLEFQEFQVFYSRSFSSNFKFRSSLEDQIHSTQNSGLSTFCVADHPRGLRGWIPSHFSRPFTLFFSPSTSLFLLLRPWTLVNSISFRRFAFPLTLYDSTTRQLAMADLQGRKVFKVFNQDFIVSEQYNVTKELGQGAYGIVW